MRYGTRLGDLKENWFLLFSNKTLNTHRVQCIDASHLIDAVHAGFLFPPAPRKAASLLQPLSRGGGDLVRMRLRL